jgi:hypothetical protein
VLFIHELRGSDRASITYNHKAGWGLQRFIKFHVINESRPPSASLNHVQPISQDHSKLQHIFLYLEGYTREGEKKLGFVKPG